MKKITEDSFISVGLLFMIIIAVAFIVTGKSQSDANAEAIEETKQALIRIEHKRNKELMMYQRSMESIHSRLGIIEGKLDRVINDGQED